VSELTKELVVAYAAHMAKAFGAKFVQKDNSELMALAATVLNAIGVQDREMFLKHFTTTIGHTIYIPFVIGEESPGYPLWWQIQVIAHECEHVYQFEGEESARKDPGAAIEFSWSYLTSEQERSMWEWKAYRTNVELHYWRHGNTGPSAAEWVAPLKHYGMSEGAIKAAEIALDLAMHTIRDSKPQSIINESSWQAILWLEEHAPWLAAVR